jgi:transposase
MRSVGRVFTVGKSSISRWIRNIQDDEDAKNSKQIGIKKDKKVCKMREDLKNMIKEIIGDTWIGRAKDVQDILEKKYNVIKSISTIWRMMKHLDLSHKQVRKKVETKNNTKEIKDEYKKVIKEIGYEKVLCFDEVGFQLEMDPKKGWSRKGTRCLVKKSKGGRTNYTGSFLISVNGVESWQIKKGGVKGDDLLEFFDKTSKDIIKNKTLVLDNARSHHRKDVKENFKKLGITGKWLPPYSPELNPIEEVFSWLKTRLRWMRIRKEEELKKGIEELVKEVNKKGVLERFKHSYE